MEFEPPTLFAWFRNLSGPVKFGLLMGIYSAVVTTMMSMAEEWTQMPDPGLLPLPILGTWLLIVWVLSLLIQDTYITVLGLLIALGVQGIFHFSLAYAVARFFRKVVIAVAAWFFVQVIAFFFFGYLVAVRWNF